MKKLEAKAVQVPDMATRSKHHLTITFRPNLRSIESWEIRAAKNVFIKL
jgi:hypothetical protein